MAQNVEGRTATAGTFLYRFTQRIPLPEFMRSRTQGVLSKGGDTLPQHHVLAGSSQQSSSEQSQQRQRVPLSVRIERAAYQLGRRAATLDRPAQEALLTGAENLGGLVDSATLNLEQSLDRAAVPLHVLQTGAKVYATGKLLQMMLFDLTACASETPTTVIPHEKAGQDLTPFQKKLRKTGGQNPLLHVYTKIYQDPTAGTEGIYIKQTGTDPTGKPVFTSQPETLTLKRYDVRQNDVDGDLISGEDSISIFVNAANDLVSKIEVDERHGNPSNDPFTIQEDIATYWLYNNENGECLSPIAVVMKASSWTPAIPVIPSQHNKKP